MNREAEQEQTQEDDLARVFRAQYAQMVTLAWFMVRSTPLAEDIVQEAVVKLREAWPRVENPSAYLRTSVVNGCRKAQRRAGRERLEAAPDDRVSQDQIDETLELLVRLPASQRTALILRYYLDLPTAEIATLLGWRPATVRSRIRRGLAALKETLDR